MTFYWLSFCDSSLPEGEQFLGGCIIAAESGEEAMRKAWKQHCNPGGEVAIVEITPEYEHNVANFKTNHLYTSAELKDMGEYRLLSDAIRDGDVT